MTAPLTREERPRRDVEPQGECRAPRATRTALKRHPCPTCDATGQVRQSFGFAYPGDPESEAWAMVPCRTCKGSGARPKDWVEPRFQGVATPSHQFRGGTDMEIVALRRRCRELRPFVHPLAVAESIDAMRRWLMPIEDWADGVRDGTPPRLDEPLTIEGGSPDEPYNHFKVTFEPPFRSRRVPASPTMVSLEDFARELREAAGDFDFSTLAMAAAFGCDPMDIPLYPIERTDFTLVFD